MLKQIFGSRPTTKVDVWIGFGAAALAVIKALDTHRTYKTEQEEIQRSASTKKENSK